MIDQPDAQFGIENCTCRPFSRQDGATRYCQPGDTVDKISGWERGGDCPHHTPAPTDLREQYAAALWPLTDWDGDVLNAEAAADAVLAVRDRELEQLRNELAIEKSINADLRVENEARGEKLARFHEGEEPHTDELTEATPAQWIWLWNRATPERRLEVVKDIKAHAALANRCVMAGHETRLEELRAEVAELRQRFDNQAQAATELIEERRQLEDRVRGECDRLRASAVLADGEPHTDRERGIVAAVTRVLAALNPQEQP